MNEKLQRFLSLFKGRNKWASPYYGTSGALFHGSAVPLRVEEKSEANHLPTPSTIEAPVPKRKVPHNPEIDWERLRFELMKMLVCQDRRSVVLGKLKSTNKQIANTCRVLTDAAIRELQLHPLKSHEEDDERGDHADERGGE